MKPEPLVNKKRHFFGDPAICAIHHNGCDIDCCVFKERDVTSAVAWLKEEIDKAQKPHKEKKKDSRYSLAIVRASSGIKRMIDVAFKDVVRFSKK